MVPRYTVHIRNNNILIYNICYSFYITGIHLGTVNRGYRNLYKEGGGAGATFLDFFLADPTEPKPKD